MNSYRVLNAPNKTVYQYDVIIGTGAEKRVVQQKVWASKKRKAATGQDIIWDGNKLAWSLKDYKEVRQIVDLDEEEKGKPSQDGRNAFRLHIVRTKQVNLHNITAYLQGKIQFNIDVMEGVNFLDHLLREGPSQNPNLIAVRRSFFARNGSRSDLGGGIEVFRGVYQSLRLVQGGQMVINLDVSNSCFWKPQNVLNAIRDKNKYRDANEIARRFTNSAEVKATQKYLSKLSCKANYPGNKTPSKVWNIRAIAKVTANTHKITWRDQNGKETGEMVTVAQYFKRKYNVSLALPELPLVEMTKKIAKQPVYFPMELLVLVENQRYGAKLDEIQTANMIKFAVSPPHVRQQAINEGKTWLRWEQDQWLSNYGLQIDRNQVSTQARILPPPGIKFGGNKVEQPGTKGKWDLRGKRFLTGNPNELVSWGIGLFEGRTRLQPAQVEKFATDFIKAYRGHGGVVANGLPHIMQLPRDAGQAVEALQQGTGNKFNRRPQLLIFLVQDKNAHHYLRIKKSCDCRFGVVSQVMQAAQVQKGNPQYYSNVLMKVNAKLGGCTSMVQPHQTSGFKGTFPGPTAFIGADVSHPSPGSEQASMAAITLSFDKHAGRYAAGCQTNGHRIEMITDKNMRAILGPLMTGWVSDVGGGRLPTQIYYMRDGVSEGQYIKVMNEEVPAIRGVLDKINGRKWEGKITVIIASKRHHIRAFPKQGDGDQKGNPQPGTLIERDVTMPLEFDFYLYSHIALQGTSRPVHYTVLLDEAKHPASVLQNMIYEHCYQYMRSTTSVSLHPAVYYAHIASNRAKAHEDIPAALGPQGGSGFKQNQGSSSDAPRSSDVAPLIEMHSASRIKFAMWYI